MSTRKPADAAKPAATTDAPTEAKGSGMLWKVIVLGFIVAVIGGECLVAVMYVSSASQKLAEADDQVQAEAGAAADEHASAEAEKPQEPHAEEASQGDEESHEEHAEHADEGHGDAHGEHGSDGESHRGGTVGSHGEVEVDMGEFSLTATEPSSNTTLMINFHLYGIVDAKDEADFTHRYDANLRRVREKVIETVRAAEMADLNDPGLGLIKRQILAKTNKSLGKALLQEVIISDILTLEQ